MENTVYLSRATLLLPPVVAGMASAEHRLIHALMSGENADARRNFLYSRTTPSSDGQPRYLVQSTEPPRNNALFSVETKQVGLQYNVGDELLFSITANPTQHRTVQTGHKYSDAISDALAALTIEERRKQRADTIQAVGVEWFSSRGERGGFSVEPHRVEVEDYGRTYIQRDGAKDIPVTRLSLRGVLTVTDPDAFATTLQVGLGRSRAFGYGMLKVRRI
jgi:CRISPR system Cascade subunit CasE